MITIKSTREFELMTVAGRCVAEVHAAIREAAKPGVSMLELDSVSHAVLEAHDCTPSFLGYHGFPATICASPNDVIVHGIPTDYRLQEGDILSIDSGAIYQGYHGDAAFTMAIGEVPAEVLELIETTERAMWAGIGEVRHGNRIGDIGAAVETVGRAGGYGIVQEYVGHGIGRQMHEEPQVPNYGTPGRGMRLRKGMALCIEPMFNLGGPETRVDADEWTVRTADGSLSAHWEHTVCITPDGPVVTTFPADAHLPVPLG
ncbi:MAG TPA: type I methionyl aminopeptidase [Acidimicrobiia bacterium]|nr:type I methionyl aminopeptidase [Acidimicrobiia bacterium]